MMKMETCKSCRGSNFGGFKFFHATIEKSQLAVGKVTFLQKKQRKISNVKAGILSWIDKKWLLST